MPSPLAAPPTAADLIAAPWLPWALGGVLLLVLLAALGSLWWLSRRRAAAGQDGAAEEPNLFDEQLARLRETLATVGELTGQAADPYAVPWVALLGTDGAEGWNLLNGVDAAPGHGAVGTLAQAGTVRLCQGGVIFHGGDDLIGAPGGMRRWRRLVTLLQAGRPFRPLDALVVAVPADRLAGPNALSCDALAALGDGICEMIWAAQRITGLRIPLSLVIANGQRLPGFSGLLECVPAEARGEVVGWSVPYALDTVFSPAWIDAGISELSDGLAAFNIQALLAGGPEEHSDAMVLFPGEVRGLAPALKVLLTAMLQSSAYHDAFLFRGFYLSGTAEDGAVAFVRRLFADKVFPERRLVRPVRGLVLARARRLRLAQAALAVALLAELAGLIDLSVSLPRTLAPIEQLVAEIEDDTSLARKQVDRERGHDTDVESPRHKMRAASKQLLTTMTLVDRTTLTTPLAPTSYLAQPDRPLNAAIAVGYNRVVVREIGTRLSEIGKDLVTPPPESEALLGDSDRLPRLNALIARLARYRAEVDLYRNLPERHQAADLRELANYALEIPLSEEFVRNSTLYADALKDTHPEPPPLDEEALRQRLVLAVDGVYAARFDDQDVVAALRRIAGTLRGEVDTATPGAARESLEVLRKDLGFVQRSLESPVYGWLNGNGTALADDIEQALRRIGELGLTSEEFGGYLRKLGQERLTSARQRVRAMVGSGTVPLLRAEDNKLLLSPDMVKVSTVVEGILGRSFMGEPPPATPRVPDGSQPLAWDSQRLGEIAHATDDWRDFIEHDLPKLPPGMQDPARSAAQTQFLARVSRTIDRAPTPLEGGTGDDALRLEIRAFAGTQQSIGDRRAALLQLGFGELALRLGGIASTQAGRLLAAVDGLRSMRTAYLPVDPSFLWWDGATPFAARAFGAANAAELAAALDGERQTLTRLAHEDAEPLVRFLDRQSDDTPALLRWRGILSALAAYEQKDNAGNSLRRLEHFVLAEMDQVDAGKCGGLPVVATQLSDFFVQRLQVLVDGVGTRCAALHEQWAAGSYKRLHDLFNATLANRFPFAAPGAPRIKEPADPDDVRRFFLVYARETADPRRKPGGEPGDFIDDLGTARQALGPMLSDPSLGLPLSYEVEAEFRSNLTLDQGGNQIIEWILDLGGDQRISSLEPKRKATWVSGQAVRLALRWARNSPKVPVAAPGGPKVDGVIASWEFSDPWALLSLLSSRAPSQDLRSRLAELRPETLRLEVPLHDNPDAATGARPPFDTAVVFLRLRLATVTRAPGQPDSRAAITLPRFPFAAPEP